MKLTHDLEDRLINFACSIITISETLPKTQAANHLSSQLIRSGTAPALHYGEAQGGESRNDFIHKMKIALKELRETFNCLRIICKMNWAQKEWIGGIINENDQLIAIFVKSIKTAQFNIEAEKMNKLKSKDSRK